LGFAGPSAAASDVTGSAFGYSLNVSLFGAPQPPIGPAPTVALPDGGSATPMTASAPTGVAKEGPATFFSSGQLDVSTQGTPGGTVTSSAKIGKLNTTGQEALNADSVESTCTAAAGGASGSVTIGNGSLAIDNGDDPPTHPETRVPVPANPPPNTAFEGHIHVNGAQDNFRYVFNEQIANADGSLTVNAFHEFVLGPTAVGDLFVGQVVCSLAGATTGSTAPPDTTTTTTVAGGGGGGTNPGSPSTGGGGSGMPTTGTNVMPLVFIGLELVGAGLLAVRWATRRRVWPLR